jgi:hypothetical protein
MGLYRGGVVEVVGSLGRAEGSGDRASSGRAGRGS